MSNYPNEKQQQPSLPPAGAAYTSTYPPPAQPQFTPAPYNSPPPPAQVASGSGAYPGAVAAPPNQFLDPTAPRPNDILPLHPAIIQQRQIAASLPPCPRGGYHELRSQYGLGANAGTFLSIVCFPIVCCCVKEETACIKCQEKFNIALPRIH